jgi:hypothetical protein
MDFGTFPPSTIGWVAIGAAAAGLVALASAILFSAIGQAFGAINDASMGIAGLASATLAMLIFPEHRLPDQQMGVIALALAVAGGSITAFGSLLSIFGVTSWFLSGLYMAAGNALTGLWLVLIIHTGWGSAALPQSLLSAGSFTGVVMALGLAALPGILSGRESERSAPWVSRYVGRAGNLGSLLLYPIWCIWLGRILLAQ